MQALFAGAMHLGAELVVQGGLRQAGFGAYAFAGFAEAQQQAADAVRGVANGAQGEVEPGFHRSAIAFDDQLLIAQYPWLTAAGSVAGRLQQGPGRAPAVASGLAEFGRVAIADQCGVGVVVQLQRLVAPEDAHRQGRFENGVQQQP